MQIDSATPQKSWLTRWLRLYCGVLVAFLVIGVVLLAVGSVQFKRNAALDSSHLVPVDLHIDEAHPSYNTAASDGAGGTTCDSYYGRMSWTWEGATYSSKLKRWNGQGVDCDYKLSGKLIPAADTGEALPGWLEPTNPAAAYLDKKNNLWQERVYIILGCVAIVIFFILLTARVLALVFLGI